MKVWLLAFGLWFLAGAAEAGYSAYRPEIVYGVDEPGENRFISYAVLEKYPNINMYANEVNKRHACGYIYGCEMTLEDNVAKTRNKYTKAVDKFAKRFSLGKPRYMLAITGDYENYECSSYDPEDPEESQNMETRKDKDSKSSVDETGMVDEGESQDTECDHDRVVTSNTTFNNNDDSESSKDKDGTSEEVEAQASVSKKPTSLENGYRTDGTTQKDEHQTSKNIQTPSNQASFHKECCDSFEYKQDSPVRIKSFARQSTNYPGIQKMRPKTCNAVLNLNHQLKSKAALRMWGEVGGISS